MRTIIGILLCFLLSSCIKEYDEYYINCAPKADTLMIVLTSGDTLVCIYDYEEYSYNKTRHSYK